MSRRHKRNVRLKSPSTSIALTTSLQKKPISHSIPDVKKSHFGYQVITNNSSSIGQNDYALGHNITKLPIQSQYELTTNTSVQKKTSSHNNSCGCAVCRKTIYLSPKIQPVFLKHQHFPLTQNNKIIFPSLTLANKIAAKSSTSPTSQTISSNFQLVAEKTSPTIQRGFFKRVKKGFKRVGRSLRKTVSRGWKKAKKTGGRFFTRIKRGFRKIGKGLKSFAGKTWRRIKKISKFVWNGLKWISKSLWSKLKGIFYRVVRWITKLPTRIGRLLLHIWKGVKSLKPWSLKWWKSLGNISSWEGLLSWLGKSLVYLLEIAGVGEIYETVMDFVKFNTRPLTSTEIAKAQTVFGNSINYPLVRVDKTAIIGPSFSGRAYVSFQTINAWGTVDDFTFIHELTHVWQYERMGAIYMPKAIHAQEFGAGYNYGGIKELSKRKAKGQGFTSFNMEQQGQILGDYYYYKEAGVKGKEDLKQLHSGRYKAYYKYFKDNNPTWTHNKIESEVEAAMQREARNINLSIYEYFVKQVR